MSKIIAKRKRAVGNAMKGRLRLFLRQEAETAAACRANYTKREFRDQMKTERTISDCSSGTNQIVDSSFVAVPAPILHIRGSCSKAHRDLQIRTSFSSPAQTGCGPSSQHRLVVDSAPATTCAAEGLADSTRLSAAMLRLRVLNTTSLDIAFAIGKFHHVSS